MEYKEYMITEDNYKQLLLRIWFNRVIKFIELKAVCEFKNVILSANIEQFMRDNRHLYADFNECYTPFGTGWTWDETSLADWLVSMVRPLALARYRDIVPGEVAVLHFNGLEHFPDGEDTNKDEPKFLFIC